MPSNSRTYRKVWFAVLACCLLAAGACGRDRDAEPLRQKLSVKSTDNGIEVTSADGTVRIFGNDKTGGLKIKSEGTGDVDVRYRKDSLAPGFPADIPLYQPAVVRMSQCFQGRNAVATLATTDNLTKVAQFYRDSLTDKGFTPGDEVMLNDLVLLQGVKDTFKLNISLKRSQTETIINLAMTQSQP